jgi:hypothetical protein
MGEIVDGKKKAEYPRPCDEELFISMAHCGR